MTETQSRRLPDITYSLPDELMRNMPDGFEEMYQAIVNNLAVEAMEAGRPLTTFEQLLMERCAYYYIYVRVSENGGGFNHATEAKQANQFWLEMSREFETRVKGSDSEKLFRLVESAFSRALNHIPEELRASVSAAFGNALAEADL